MTNELRDFYQTIENLGKTAENVCNAISNSIQPLVNIATQFNEVLQSEKVKETFRNLAEFAEGVYQTEEDIKSYKEVMLILGYPPNVSMDIYLMREIGREYIKYSETDLKLIIDEVMVNHYNPIKIDEIKNTWETYEFIKERLPLLRQVMNAHKLGMFALSIPSLSSQMEGIIIDAYKITGRVAWWKFEKLVKEFFYSNGDETFDFNNEIGSFYNKFILDGFEHGKEIKYDVSRHAILHGGAKPVSFAKEEVSLKLILMMDNILYRVSELTDIEIEETRRKLKFEERS